MYLSSYQASNNDELIHVFDSLLRKKHRETKGTIQIQ